jgi:hypothetical protein
MDRTWHGRGGRRGERGQGAPRDAQGVSEEVPAETKKL